MNLPYPSKEILDVLRKGVVIPASPLALDAKKQLDYKYQKAVYRYYIASGALGIAVGVHTTQFEIRDPQYNLFKPLLKFAVDSLKDLEQQYKKPLIKVAGICGKTSQAVKEAEYAASIGYDIGLLSLGAMKDSNDKELIQHCKEISKHIPLMGFYLQPAVGGRILPYSFWREFMEIQNVVSVKMAPFNRYYTLDVVKALAHSERENEITLYTGNDDNIILDLLTPFRINTSKGEKVIRIKGGLLGQWAVWTSKAVELLNTIHSAIEQNTLPFEFLSKNASLTDANSVVFDVPNQFSGCISGINEILRRQGLLQYSHCLSQHEKLSPGQAEEIKRIYKDYPWLTDDEFIQQNLADWLKD